MAKPYHVIFLGAGASATSGYPVGDALRLRLSSSEQFRKDLDSWPNDKGLLDDACRYFETFDAPTKLFRNGCFSTVDEFCRLAAKEPSSKDAGFAQQMKILMRLALAVHNPEGIFHESDYYPFVQHLFQDDELHALKTNIAVLSYNYDCYLDYLLRRAYIARQGLAGPPRGLAHWSNKLTSGFVDIEDSGWAIFEGFSYFKLHGSILENRGWSFDHLFQGDSQKRLRTLMDDYHKQTPPPIVFPWELLDESGAFIDEEDFIFVKTRLRHQYGPAFYNLYKRIWHEAHDAVKTATKISFVGLSGHPYMDAGLKYLFQGKEGGVHVVVANKANSDFKDAGKRMHPASPCGRMYETLRKVAPEMKCCRSLSEEDGIFRAANPSIPEEPGITPRYSFREFIEKEMN